MSVITLKMLNCRPSELFEMFHVPLTATDSFAATDIFVASFKSAFNENTAASEKGHFMFLFETD